MDYLAIIKQALYKAEDPRTPENEKEISRAHAYRLMAQMQISEADLEAHGGDGPKEEIQVREIWPSTPRTYSYEYATMMGRIAEITGAKGLVQKVYHTDATRTKRCGAHWIALIIGFPSDLDRAELLFRSVGVQCEQVIGTTGPKHAAWSYMTASDKYNFKRSFIAGFKQQVAVRLKALYAEVADEIKGTSTALVIIDHKKLVEDFVNSTMNVTSTRARSYTSQGAGAGRAAGARANLGQAEVGRNNREIGGRN